MGAALRRSGSRPLAEEAAQNVFILLVKKAATVPPDRLAAWLHRAAWLEAGNLTRHEARVIRAVPHPETATDPAMNRPDAFEKLDAALQSLPEFDRELLLRRYSFGESVREIAARVGKSVEACQKRLERVLEVLRGKLGTRGTAAVVVAGMQQFASTKADAALVQQISSAALSHAPSAGGAAGGIAANLAACLAAAALAAAAAWPSEAPAAAAPTASASRPPVLAGAAKKTSPALAPRPPEVRRSLVDVLDSIAAGRLGPLVEFFPQATERDLRAILREDDLSGMGERSMERSTAHWLATRHWATIQPAGAWEYALSREHEREFRPMAGVVFHEWTKRDAAAAWQALANLSPPKRLAVGRAVAAANETLGEEFLTRYPEYFWVIDHIRQQYGKDRGLAKSRRIADEALQGRMVARAYEVTAAFRALAEQDAAAVIAEAQQIPDAYLKGKVIESLARNFPEHFPHDQLPAGKVRRTVERARYVARLEKEDLPMPDEPSLQVVWLETRGPKLSYDAPLQLLENFAAANMTACKIDTNIPDDTSSGRNWLTAALTNAARLDGPRTMKLLPRIIQNMEYCYLPGMLEAIVRGWVKTDPAGAIRWTMQHKVPGMGNHLHSALQGVTTGGEALLASLPSANGDQEIYFLTAISAIYEQELNGEAPEQILSRVNPAQADKLLRNTLGGTMGEKDWPQSLRIVSRASREEQLGYMLPNLATLWLCSDPAKASAWIKSLPAEEQQAIFEKAGSHYEFDEAGRAAFEQLKNQ